MDNSRWFALFVQSGQEENVRLRLEYRFEEFGSDIRFMIPRRKLKERKNGKWHERLRVLFPGYILIKGEINVQEYYAFKNVPGLYKLIKSDMEPVPLMDEEAEFFDQLIREDDIIGYSDLLLRSGRIVVVDGPLTSLEGQIVKIDKRKGRAKVRMNFLGEERIIELGINLLEAAD